MEFPELMAKMEKMVAMVFKVPQGKIVWKHNNKKLNPAN